MYKKRKERRFTTIFLVIICIGFVIFYYWNEKQEQKLKSVPLPTKLHEAVAKKRDRLVEFSAEKGIKIIITEEFRSFEEQDQLYSKGRTEDGEIVTYAKGGESYHNFGLAIDFAILTIDGNVIWDMTYDGNDNGKRDWIEVVDIAKSLGFEWGGDWQQFKDYPHLQMDFGLSIQELQMGKRP